MPKVEIRALARFNDGGEMREAVRVFVDGQPIGSGHYGGEPEDNSRRRDYGWVEDMFLTLASKLGAEVEHTYKELTEEEWEKELY